MINDGKTSTSSNTLGKFCGANIPPILKSSGNSLYVTFKSDSSITAAGYSFTWGPRGEEFFTEATTTKYFQNYNILPVPVLKMYNKY